MKEFELTAEHIKLLRAANVSWQGSEYGAPAIDCKRPYGNSSVEYDMAKLLGVSTVEVDGGEERLLESDAERLRKLHEETETALQVVLATGSFEPGTYVAERYSRNWRRKAERRTTDSGEGEA